MKIIIRKSIPNDVYGIREVQRITWLKTVRENRLELSLWFATLILNENEENNEH